jgi:hypothetical protein
MRGFTSFYARKFRFDSRITTSLYTDTAVSICTTTHLVAGLELTPEKWEPVAEGGSSNLIVYRATESLFVLEKPCVDEEDNVLLAENHICQREIWIF